MNFYALSLNIVYKCVYVVYAKDIEIFNKIEFLEDVSFGRIKFDSFIAVDNKPPLYISKRSSI